MNENSLPRTRISPVRLIPISFFIAIVIGTLLLLLPFSSASGEKTDLLTALFTATTSVCVTGLVVVDTYSHWSSFGHVVILLLIQMGGLGVVAVGSMFMIVGKKKFTLADRVLLNDSLNVEKKRGLLSFLIRIFRGTFIVEGIGAVLYAFKFIHLYGPLKGLSTSIFHSISAFCNAGIDIIGPDSMIGFQESPYLLCVTMTLIILGGLGFVVWVNLVDGIRHGIRNHLNPRRIFRHLPVHTKLVLSVTGFLILSGGIVFFIVENHNPGTIGGMGLSGKIFNSLFQSVTLRTAGFASIPQQNLTEASCMISYILMFIGGSPVGTAGGVKTVTAVLVFMNSLCYIRGKREIVIFKRRVPVESLRKAAAVFFVSFFVVLLMTVLLLARGGIDLTDGLFEIVSALGTVGLSRNLTSSLDRVGRILVVISMYLGRIGPISMAVFFAKAAGNENKVHHADGTFYVG